MARATEIEIVLKDEVTGAAVAVHASLKRLRAEAKRTMPIGKKVIDSLERTIEAVGREMRESALALGASSVLFSGSFVTALASIATSLDSFAENALKQHSVAREVGLTYDQFERLVVAAKARGVSDRDARAGVEKLARSVRDLSLGTRSATRDRLEEGGFRDTGTIISREFQDSLRRNGLYETMLEVLGRMGDKAREGEEGRWAAQVLGESMGVNGSAWNGLKEMLEKIQHIAIPSEEASRKYKLASRKLEIALTKIRSRMTAATMPIATKLLKMMAEYFNEERTQRFAAWLRGVVKALLDFPWDKLRERIDAVLSLVGTEIVNFTEHLAGFVESIDQFMQMVNRWREKNRGREGDAAQPPLLSLPEINVDEPDANTPQKFSGGGGPLPFSTNPASDDKFDMSGVLTASNAKIGAQNIDDRRQPGYGSYSEEGDSSDEKLIEQTEKLAFEMRRFVDVLRDLRGGAGGGSSDGGVSQKARTRPMATKAGGASGTPQTEDQREAAANPISRGAVSGGPVPVGPRVVKGSWFGNYPKSLGSRLGWNDPDDQYTSGPKKGQAKPNYGGYSQDVPGIAIPYRQAAGPAEKQQGMPVRVWDQRPGRASVMGRVIDIGPNQIDPRSRNKGIDVNAALAERLGYAPTKKTAEEHGLDVFPTGQSIKYQVLRTEDILRARTEMQHERQRIEKTAIKWHRQGQLDLNVNVDGPKGIKVDAGVDGDMDGNVNINRGGVNQRSSSQSDPTKLDEWELRKERALGSPGRGYSEWENSNPDPNRLTPKNDLDLEERKMEQKLRDRIPQVERAPSSGESEEGQIGGFNPRTGEPLGVGI
jgi:hypothetical protein